ncbi:MAG: hypothetical protein HMLKMBBP_01561 [Planctomycetes bacterium]|nr:hypothetical protein [Planctomycetota bacterium]
MAVDLHRALARIDARRVRLINEAVLQGGSAALDALQPQLQALEDEAEAIRDQIRGEATQPVNLKRLGKALAVVLSAGGLSAGGYVTVQQGKQETEAGQARFEVIETRISGLEATMSTRLNGMEATINTMQQDIRELRQWRPNRYGNSMTTDPTVPAQTASGVRIPAQRPDS